MKDKYKTLIISCWAVLLCCFVVKLLGGNFFEIVCENEKFIRFCEFVDGNILKYVISFILYFISTYIYFLAIIKNKVSKKKHIIIIITLILWWFIKLLLNNAQAIIFVLDILYMILIPIIINKKIWLFSIISFFLNLAFQLISLLTKNIGIKFVDDSMFIAIIFNIDYYIMILLFYLYRTKEYDKNGINWFTIFRFRRQRKHQ